MGGGGGVREEGVGGREKREYERQYIHVCVYEMDNSWYAKES